MENINVPTYSLKLKSIKGEKLVFDEIRKKYVIFTPEEFIRQNFVQFLIHAKGYPASLISIEKAIHYNGMIKRYDIAAFSSKNKVLLLVECKAPKVKIDQNTMDQASLYMNQLNAEFFILTNGNENYCFRVKKDGNTVNSTNIPSYLELNN